MNRAAPPGRRNVNPLLNGRDVDAYVQGVLRAAEENAVDGADVAVIAAPGDGDVSVGRQAIVGGIEIDGELVRR